MNTGEVLIITHFPYIIIAVFMLIQIIFIRKYLLKIKQKFDLK